MQVLKTDIFEKWFNSLKDRQAKRIIATRIDRVSYGLLGDIKSIGNGVSELKIDYGPGYRVIVNNKEMFSLFFFVGVINAHNKKI